MDFQLKFRERTAVAVSKVSHILSILHRSFALLNETTLPLLFQTMVRTQLLEYGNSVWRHFNGEDQNRIEWVMPFEINHAKRGFGFSACRRCITVVAAVTWSVYRVLRQGVDLETKKFLAAAATGNTRRH